MLLTAGMRGGVAYAQADRRARLRDAAFGAGSVAQVIVSTDGVVVLANTVARTMFGLAPGDIGRRLSDLELSYRPVELRSRIDTALANGHAVQVSNVEHRSSPTDVIHLDVWVTPLTVGGDEALGVAVTFEDITRYERLRRKLHESSQELETAYEELQSANEELETMNEELQSANAEQQETNHELMLRGQELDVAVEELSEQNEALAEARHEIEDERRRYRELFEEAPEAYIVTDAKGLVQRANHRSLSLLDAPAASVVGVPLAVFVPLDDRVAFRSRVAGLAAGTPMRDWRARITRRRDGLTVPVAIDATPSIVGDEVREIRWLLRDISELVRTQEVFEALLQHTSNDRDRLEDLDAWKSAFIAAAAHDLRAPLAAIATLAAQLLVPADTQIDVATGLKTIVRESDELQRLLGDLLDLDRFTRGVVELRDQPVDLAALVRSETERMRIQSHDVELALAPAAVRAEAQRVSQIVNNLLRNAVQHTSAGTKVWARTAQTADGAMIIVDDAVVSAARMAGLDASRRGLPLVRWRSDRDPEPAIG
jgi:PAS domain S-box-containing protein